MDERWRRLNEMFDDLADAEPDERDRVLDALDDERLEQRVRAMLRAHDEPADRARAVVDRAFEAWGAEEGPEGTRGFSPRRIDGPG